MVNKRRGWVGKRKKKKNNNIAQNLSLCRRNKKKKKKKMKIKRRSKRSGIGGFCYMHILYICERRDFLLSGKTGPLTSTRIAKHV